MRKYAIVVVLSTATAVSTLWAQAPAGSNAPSVVRKVLQQRDLALTGSHTLTMVSVEIPVGGREGRHTHPGAAVVYVQEGAFTFDYGGMPTVTYKAGESFSIEAGMVHEGINRGTVPAKGLATFITPKGQPLATQVP